MPVNGVSAEGFAPHPPSRSLGYLPPEGKASYSTNKGGSHLAVSTEKIYDAGQQYAAVCHLQLQLQAAQLLHPPVSELRARLAGRMGVSSLLQQATNLLIRWSALAWPMRSSGSGWTKRPTNPASLSTARRLSGWALWCCCWPCRWCGSSPTLRSTWLFVPLRAGQLYENAVYPVHPLADAEPAGRHRRCADHAEPAALLPAVPERLKNGRYRFFAGKCAGRFDIHGVCVHCGRVLAVLQAQGI